jgi:tetratricopeptide (TPR) repeat protein
VFLAVGLIAAATASPTRAQEGSTPHQAEYLKIYLKINDADQLERKGDFRGALADFKDCYARLQRIHNDDPSWESALVIHRMDDCRAKILYLEEQVSQMPAETPETTAPDTTLTGGGAPAAPAPAGSDEEEKLRAQLSQVQQELEDTQAKYRNEQLETNSLRTQLDAVNQELSVLKSGQSADERMGKLLDQNKKLTDKLSSAEKELATLKPVNPKSALGKIGAELKATQDKLDASEAANAALQQTTTTLQSQLDQAQADLRAANQRLTDTAPNSADYDKLKRENEIMRDILTRELQEQAHRDMAKRLMQEEFDRLKITSTVLREQLDIASSPMTPPTSDQERDLLESLKTTPGQVATPAIAGGNSFAAPAGENSTTNSAAGSAPSPENTGAMATTDTNTPSAQMPPTNAPATPEMAAANPPSAGDTNQPPVTVITPPATTNAAPETNSVSGESAPMNPGVGAPSLPATNSIAATPNSETPSTNAAPDLTAGAATNAPAATTNLAGGSPPDTNAAPNQAIPPAPTGTTTTTETTINNGGEKDTTDYSNKPRLPDDMRDTAQQAADLFKMQRYDEAADKYQSIIEKYPDSLYAWSNLGVVRFQQGKLPEALKALQQAVKLSPTDAFSYSNLGIVYYQLGQFENAISALERALALDPNNAMSHNYLGCACSQKGWQEVAEKEFTKAIELNDSFGDAHFNLALIYATEKPPSLEMARRHYKRALELGIQPDPRLEKLLQMDVGQVTPASGIK